MKNVDVFAFANWHISTVSLWRERGQTTTRRGIFVNRPKKRAFHDG
jgi:hypothetical protein